MPRSPGRLVAEAPPAPGYAAHAPRPSIGFSIDLPDHWTVLDLNPRTWDAWLDTFLDARLARRPQAQVERGPARAALFQLLRQLHDEGVFLAAVLAGEVEGQLISASATLAWRRPDLGPDPLDVEGLREVFAQAPAAVGEERAARRVERRELPSGPAVKVVSKETARVPTLATLRLVAVVQHFVPVQHDGWLAVITVTTGVRELETGIEAVADAMAESLTFQTGPSSAER